jgi:hypothetical protein
MLHTNGNQNLCIQVVKVNIKNQIKLKRNIFFIQDLTPPISVDLADTFRQTIIMVSNQSTSV